MWAGSVGRGSWPFIAHHGARGKRVAAQGNGPPLDISRQQIAPWMGYAPMAVIEGRCALHTHGWELSGKNTPSCRAALIGKAHSRVDVLRARWTDLPKTVGGHPRSRRAFAFHGGYGCVLQLDRLRVRMLPFGLQCSAPAGTP
jgi:hypothetical protein